MKAIETTATINENGELTLDRSLEVTKPQRVRVIVLMIEEGEEDPDETPTEIAIEGIR
ncbi:type II toxin-antitoxin system RelN family antitoxin [Limnospira indica]|uniref:type II toxin-antitoxin system RelN family antitoxin n=1 Tax=Limnospira indica TaxID=147322 RepID=UPI0001E2A297